ncbi:MAG TPA: hypothetical protein DHV55_12390 [Clostridiaceae bacterium]|nr:hypothetical protein [Clostridiaceae bacterium]
MIDVVNEANSKQEAKDAMFRIQEIVQDELPMLTLLYPSNTYAMDKRLQDVKLIYGNYYQPAEWHVNPNY